MDRALRSLRSLRSLAALASHWCSIDFRGSWKSLGVSWKRLGGLLKALGVSWELLAASWDYSKIDAQASKIIPKTIPNPPENLPKSAQKRSKNEVWRGLCFGSLLGLFFSRICGRLGPSRAPLGTILEPSWGVWRRLGAVLARPRDGLGPSLGRLGASWRILGASWERLGASWKRFGTISTKNFGFLSIFAPNFDARNLKNIDFSLVL